MLITKSWLVKRGDRFGVNLIHLLERASPHFGKLDGKLTPRLPHPSSSNGVQLPEEGIWLKEISQQITEENKDNEGIISKTLMTNIFSVAPNYNRTPYPYKRNPLFANLDSQLTAIYPYYQIGIAPSDYRPLKAEEIQAEDVEIFKHKLLLAGDKFSERSLTIKLTAKLPYGIELITNRHEL